MGQSNWLIAKKTKEVVLPLAFFFANNLKNSQQGTS